MPDPTQYKSDTRFYALYRSNTSCPAQLMTAPHEELGFHTSVTIDCQNCKKRHSFNKMNTYQVSTKSHAQKLENWAKGQNITLGLKL